MLSKKKLVRISELEPGMISASDITFENKMLLAKDIAITESAIEKLKQNIIVDEVEIYVEDTSEDPLTAKIETVEELENTFNEFSYNLENIFDTISNLKAPEIKEVRTFSEKIQEEFNSTGLVIKNIVFHGSGNDTIYRHSVNVAAVSFILGKWLGFSKRDINLLTYSAVLHDFGKIKISKDIINKEGNLTPEECKIFKTHPAIGYNFVKEIPYLDSSVSYGVLMHHERMDGSGYPLGIKEDKIHKFARVIAIADLFDDLSSNRYCKELSGPFEALEIIQQQSLGKLDCQYCTMFLNHIVNYYMGENVLLNNEQCCKVIQVDMNDLRNPLLLDDNGFLDLKKEKDLYVKKLVI
ncbi:HD-GYP domain-containing protein [Clostridium sp. 001]|uniref:HD-GYP domain-containing protein n=1 Tax=Clostridium sp. 001 TaxID=1970093 RepID=UPI001C2C23B5|nr:HD-GYP domain-containing protein [Clostridium sp. 001]QXE18150.1 HD family phosphohydrolase [Clostridium sp. 001]